MIINILDIDEESEAILNRLPYLHWRAEVNKDGKIKDMTFYYQPDGEFTFNDSVFIAIQENGSWKVFEADHVFMFLENEVYETFLDAIKDLAKVWPKEPSKV